jgi:hypothetical protein
VEKQVDKIRFPHLSFLSSTPSAKMLFLCSPENENLERVIKIMLDPKKDSASVRVVYKHPCTYWSALMLNRHSMHEREQGFSAGFQ